MFQIQIDDILKWTAAVFAAGFIGYFGKYLSKLIIARLHRRRAEKEFAERIGKYEYKLEKERLKLEKKKCGIPK
ncbi:hypothetical protein [Archaeoglobus veneficus]|uniref:Uncharacterized protein n=1 Tax=Archaeoglobus veneficus (strain DSM 11195 / SNP6) TaxID=693661 RepID=F2KN15_ARCVS|nr:hypothetical protein [Archaeoglobus veneficus]AEA47291.1 hypothetical protein Arcve_1285 [Archaeoglobus veneficus SNP6]